MNDRVTEQETEHPAGPVGIAALRPMDEHNRVLEAAVHPPDWTNPEPDGRYNLVVIGGGTAGLVTAAGAAGLGARVALIERNLLGGDCLNVGCVPSKALLRAARTAARVREAGGFGVGVDGAGETSIDFPKIMERMRRVRASIAPHDSAQRFHDLGVDVYLGEARFTGESSVEVAGRTLRFARGCIATGSRAASPPIPGLEETGYLTNRTVFSLTELPRRLAVIGAGPIGCELAQAFARFGAEVTLIEMGDRILPRDDADAAGWVRRSLEHDGVTIILGGQARKVEKHEDHKLIQWERESTRHELAVDEILVAAGRTPNVESLGLEAAGVTYDAKSGVEVDDRLRTSNPRLFAAGDVASSWKFTHMADALARIVIQNALFRGRARASDLTVPWCTYTEPELAQVGLTPPEAERRSISIDTYAVDLASLDRAVVDGETAGVLKVHTQRGRDTLVGATLCSAHAGESISELTLAMTAGVGLGTLAKTIHPYPTQAEAIRKAADAYRRTRLTPTLQWIFRKWLQWQRS